VQVLSHVLEQKLDLERVPVRFRKLLTRCLDRNVKDRLRCTRSPRQFCGSS
jgi:hypothetical protein